ncbi:uncharacterized protein CDAR_600311 [Caerostris darwini]|uniref:Uncharacterized protein n=1 Tax=Caerostris darwini TaxID=1538125 RepID=A0AAV4TWC5_9ARAC|nr:uncharacterized protein CDAR_600311 [Caerostris darwini]
MLESRKELVVLEANLSSASTKRSPFHLLSSIFSKKKTSLLDCEEKSVKSNEFQSNSTSNVYEKEELELGCDSIPKRCSSIPGTLNDHSKGEIEANFLSPAGTGKKKNFKIDLETLHLSRQDNPYLKQLERFSLPEETILSCADFNSIAEKALLESEWQLDSERDIDIHQHLVRSPPPQFPQNITHFIYSQANSPKRQSCQSSENGDETDKSKKPLNPVQPKKETGVLDPSIREVLEYQKSQLIAGKRQPSQKININHSRILKGLQHSLNFGQAKFGTAPAHYMPVQVNRNQNPQFRWTQDSGSRVRNSEQQITVPHATSSLPGLTSCYLELEQTCRRTTLGPLRIGRTLSDSICQDNKLRKIG